jgi:hypothetical protein
MRSEPDEQLSLQQRLTDETEIEVLQIAQTAVTIFEERLDVP